MLSTEMVEAPARQAHSRAAQDAQPRQRSGSHRGGEGAARPGRLAPFDGIRAFAVIAVLLFHAGVPGVGGGLLGVDVFFVLSGFLITSLLCGEFWSRGTIRLGQFWAARARRLLPALLILLLGVAIYAFVLRDSLDLSAIRGDAISTLLYVANWHFIVTSQGYFSQSVAPSPLLHMWSLGVEEQYYLIWPLVTLFVLRRHGPRAVAWVAGVGAAASALLMASMFMAGFSPDRLYYGTDTRAQALLVGSALGAIASRREWSVIEPRWAITQRGRIAGAVLGVLGAGWLLWSFHAFQGQEAVLYDGGFLTVALATGAVITVVTSYRYSALAHGLSVRPLAYVGRISYGIYVYHWLLFLIINHAHTGLSGFPLLAARLGATLLAAVTSFHLIEQPIRKGTLVRHLRGLAIGAAGAATTGAIVVLATVPPASANTFTTMSSLMPAAERQDLAAAGAFHRHPIRFAIFGDSVALTTSMGLSRKSVPHYGVRILDGATLGCDISPLGKSRLGGVVFTASPNADCGSWRPMFQKAMDRVHPDVVGLIVGRFELADHYYQGQWVHLGEPGWDAALERNLNQAVTIFAERRTPVLLFTFPYIDPPQEQPDGSLYPENQPSRVDAWNRIVRSIAYEHPQQVRMVNLNRMLDPQGHFTTVVDDVQVRWPNDGIHVSLAGGELLQRRVLPEAGALGLQDRESHRK